jgi:hypothetical protein
VSPCSRALSRHVVTRMVTGAEVRSTVSIPGSGDYRSPACSMARRRSRV